jgi:hypothetical protein
VVGHEGVDPKLGLDATTAAGDQEDTAGMVGKAAGKGF